MKKDIFRRKYRERVVYVNGKWVPNYEAKISIYDRGYTMGYNVYEYIRTFNKKLWQLKEHIDRGWQSLKILRIDPRITKNDMEKLCVECLERNKHLLGENEEFQIIFEITPGEYGFPHGREDWELPEGETPKPTIIVKAEPLAPLLVKLAPFYKSGCHIVSTSIIQVPPNCMDPKIKTYNRLHHILATNEAKLIDPDAFTLLLDSHGNLTEGAPGWNIWIVRDGTLMTPPPWSILRGISRANIFKLTKELGLIAIECNLQPWDLYNADEAFITSTPYCILPVGRYNGVPIGRSVPGPITQRLLKAWSEWVGVDIVGQAEYLARKFS